jgi:hypothetical protein
MADQYSSSSPTDEEIAQIAADDVSRQFLIDDYKLKVQYLTDHFSRMWTRLSYFVTVQLALFSALGYVVFDSQGRDLRVVPVVAGLGMVTSLAWYVVGAQDRFLVTAYRGDLRGTAKLLSQVLKGLSWYGPHYVGSRSGGPSRVHVEPEDSGFLSWYVEEWSITRLPSLLAIILLLCWASVGLMLYWEVWLLAGVWTLVPPPRA